jgi:hypothetical protein
LEASAFAWPPAIAGEYVMVLALASGRAGRFTDIHDLTVYPRREQFLLPRMKGSVGYHIDGSRVEISVERIENPRAAGNRSGSLSLELWALAEPFNGGPFQGHHLAGAVVGFVDGQSELSLQPMELVFSPPPPGDWQIVLMLREWTAPGYLTRDFTNFPTRYFVAAPIALRSTPESAVTEKTNPISVEDMPPQPAVVQAVPTERKTVKDDLVSVNLARLEQLVSVKGLSRKFAEAIIKKRPFASLDELRKVKGLGPKILEKVRSRLKL